MSTQDKLERILRDIHVMISKGEPYGETGGRIIIDKKQMYQKLEHLNGCLYEMMEEYEATVQSRDKAEREARKKGDRLIENANRHAQDVYAAAVLYTDEALMRAQGIMRDAEQSVQELLQRTEREMQQQRAVLRENQSELKSQLQDMSDTEKYLKLIEERNKELEKEKRQKEEGTDAASEERRREKSRYDDRKTEIKINTEYLEKMGMTLEEEAVEEVVEEKKTADKGPQVAVNLDAEYFKWRRKERKKQEG